MSIPKAWVDPNIIEIVGHELYQRESVRHEQSVVLHEG